VTDGAISADSHIVAPRELFAGLQARFGARAPQLGWDEQRGDVISIPGVAGDGGVGSIVPVGRLGIAGQRLDDPEVQAQMRRGYAGLRPGIVDPNERLKDQDVDGVAAEVLFPSLYFRVFGSPDPEILTAAFRAYNDWLAEYCGEAPDRLIGLALIPAQDPAAGAAELERVLRLGFRGVCLPCAAPKDRRYHDPAYDRIWARAQEAGVPINFHIFTGAEQGPSDLQAAGPVASYASAATVIQLTATDLICQGVAHRFPGLRFVLAEWEIGWIAQWLERLDHAFYRARFSTPSELDLTPSEYWRRQFFATFEDDRFGIMTREGIGVPSLLWANDYPHHDSIWPRSREVRDDILQGVPDAERQAMTVQNAAALYRIAVPGQDVERV
jgi:predicted TIM-barrel fold metal-dependent hydrolase